MDVLFKNGHFKNVQFRKMHKQIFLYKNNYIYKLKIGLKEQNNYLMWFLFTNKSFAIVLIILLSILICSSSTSPNMARIIL